MADLERPTTPRSVKLGAIAVLVVLAFLLFGSALTVAKASIALIGYIVVGFVAYQVGKAVGHKTRD